MKNLIQLIFQTFYAVLVGNFNEIIIVSVCLSIISILTTIFSCFTSTRILFKEEYIIVKFDADSEEIAKNRKKLCQKTTKLQYEIAAVKCFNFFYLFIITINL